MSWIQKTVLSCPQDSLDCFRKAFYEDYQYQFDPRPLPSRLNPAQAWTDHAGDCLATTWTVLLLAEKAHMKAIPVALPGHVYIHFPDLNRNWEPNRKGMHHPDSYYQQSYDLNAAHHRQAQPLSPSQWLGLWYYESANRHQSTQADLALKHYRQAVYWWPSEQTIGNLALHLWHLGQHSEALAHMHGYQSEHIDLSPQFLQNLNQMEQALGH